MPQINEDELDAIFGVIRSSLMLIDDEGEGFGEQDDSFVGTSEVLLSSQSHSRLSLELTSYITLLIVQMNIESNSEVPRDLMKRAEEVTRRIMCSSKGFQALK